MAIKYLYYIELQVGLIIVLTVRYRMLIISPKTFSTVSDIVPRYILIDIVGTIPKCLYDCFM